MCFNVRVPCNLCVLNVTNVPRDILMLTHVAGDPRVCFFHSFFITIFFLREREWERERVG